MQTNVENAKKLIDSLEFIIKNPTEGLPEDVFLFLTKISPIVNVDLLIKNNQNQTLLTWRGKEDNFWLPGWHIPGGIIRYKETMADRINAVARNELETEVKFKKKPLAINEVIQSSRKIRGHFISFLFGCTLSRPLNKNLMYLKGRPKIGQWAWHDGCPENIISVHEMYRKYI